MFAVLPNMAALFSLLATFQTTMKQAEFTSNHWHVEITSLASTFQIRWNMNFPCQIYIALQMVELDPELILLIGNTERHTKLVSSRH